MANRRTVLRSALGVCGLTFAPSVMSAERAARSEIELCLLLDTSGSMFSGYTNHILHAEVQRQGHIESLRDPEIQRTLVRRNAVVRIVLWNQTARLVGDPVLISHESDIERVIDRISANVPWRKEDAMSAANTYHDVGVRAVLSLPLLADRRIIDITTDDSVIQDRVEDCRANALVAEQCDTRINVLGIGLDETKRQSVEESLTTKDGLYIAVNDWTGYTEGLREKLRAEVMS